MSNDNATRETITQLNQARHLCLADPNNLYPQIVPGLAPIIHPDAELELRRWGSEFLAETFASPVLSNEHKQALGVQVLDQLKAYLDKKDDDPIVVKFAVQTAASLYQYVFRYIIAHPEDDGTWQKMAAIKSSILKRMDKAAAGVRLSCIKFIQAVVQVQTPGMIADPRRPDQNETSLALVPRDHPILQPSILEAEASGLLDRLLGFLQDNSSDALLVMATLNSLGSLVRKRASVANKIIAAVLSFDPFVLARSTMNVKEKIMVKSMTRTTMSFLANIIKRNPSHTLAGRIQAALERLRHHLVEAFDENSRKRAAPSELIGGSSDAKRQRLGAEVPDTDQPFPQLGPGPVSFAQLFTLTTDQGLQEFDVKSLPIDVVLRLLPPLLATIDKTKLDRAVNAVRARYLDVQSRNPEPQSNGVSGSAANGAITHPAEEEDDYEPDLSDVKADDNDFAAEDTGLQQVQVAAVELAPLHLPKPPPLSAAETLQCSRDVVSRIFGVLQWFDSLPARKAQKHGLNRLAGANRDKDAWMTLLTRLATRTSAGLELVGDAERETSAVATTKHEPVTLSESLREALYLYTIDDFRKRIDVAIAWLNEEWYSDQVTDKQKDKQTTSGNYKKWLTRILDGMLPFLDAKDKLLIRFLSEIPELDQEVIRRITRLAEDPERVNLVVMAIHYLVLYRPPTREICLDAMEELYRTYDAKNVAKLLSKWRPGVIEDNTAASMDSAVVGTKSIPLSQSPAIKVE